MAADVENPDMKVISKPARSISRAERASKQHGMVRIPGSRSSARSRPAALSVGTLGFKGRGGTANALQCERHHANANALKQRLILEAPGIVV